MDYDELVKRLRRVEGIGSGWGLPILDDESLDVTCKNAADAITKLRAERDDAIRRLADWSGQCGRTEAERDALAARHERALIAGAELRKERDAIAALLREAHTQLYSTSTSTKYSLGLLNRIDAALKDKP